MQNPVEAYGQAETSGKGSAPAMSISMAAPGPDKEPPQGPTRLATIGGSAGMGSYAEAYMGGRKTVQIQPIRQSGTVLEQRGDGGIGSVEDVENESNEADERNNDDKNEQKEEAQNLFKVLI